MDKGFKVDGVIPSMEDIPPIGSLMGCILGVIFFIISSIIFGYISSTGGIHIPLLPAFLIIFASVVVVFLAINVFRQGWDWLFSPLCMAGMIIWFWWASQLLAGNYIFEKGCSYEIFNTYPVPIEAIACKVDDVSIAVHYKAGHMCHAENIGNTINIVLDDEEYNMGGIFTKFPLIVLTITDTTNVYCVMD